MIIIVSEVFSVCLGLKQEVTSCFSVSGEGGTVYLPASYRDVSVSPVRLLQVMGLHLPEAPLPDSDEEEDSEGAAALRSRASIPMDAGQTSSCPRFTPNHSHIIVGHKRVHYFVSKDVQDDLEVRGGNVIITKIFDT